MHPTRVHLCNHYRPAEAINEKKVYMVSMYCIDTVCMGLNRQIQKKIKIDKLKR